MDVRKMITTEDIRDILNSFYAHCEYVRKIGGIALQDAVNGQAVPAGWVLDARSDYFVPPYTSEALH